MSFKKILFIGLGGAGQRHLRILRGFLPQSAMGAFRRTRTTPLLNADFTVNHENTVEAKYGLESFNDLKAAFDHKPDLTVISTPTSCHREPLMLAMEAGSGVLVEKPWAESLDGFLKFKEGMLLKQQPFLISFQRRFHPLIAKARQDVVEGAIGRPVAATFTVNSYVPSWHPYEDWRNLYAVRPEMGGGVLLTEIHEIDFAYWFFGIPASVMCSGGNLGAERLEVEDTANVTLMYKDFSVQINLCFWQKQTSRSFHITGTKGDIRWEQEGNRLVITRQGQEAEIQAMPQMTNDDMFVAQAKRFLSGWTQEDSRTSLEAAGCSLAIVEAAKRSMKSKQVEDIHGFK